jgi:hypothetical protein
LADGDSFDASQRLFFVAAMTGVYVGTKYHLRGLEERRRQRQMQIRAAAPAKDPKA